MKGKTTASVKREYDSLINTEIAIISYLRKYGSISAIDESKQRLQLWFKLQAEQDGKR